MADCPFLYEYQYLELLFSFPILYHRNNVLKQLMAGGVALIGMTLVPLLSGLFG